MIACTDKTCLKCGERKTLASFGINKAMRNGIASQCRECRRAYSKKRYATNPAEAKRMREYRSANPDKVSIHRSLYWKKVKADPERMAKRQEYEQKNKDRHTAKSKRNRETLSNCYLAGRMGISVKECDDNLLTMKREQILISRLLRELNKELKETK